ncbi:MAG: tRNA (adenosine(37)-N6)-threonylcarbamoyltransferase complex ATPase subunit type 1 TsaE [Candidatus Omnitrophica bacterium]|nr:tRNA (adenosine(37)-N6)-threonylcarbamoyltransferase complex ATPase subunit type 1 TsaE [Candidatus Omnitrophota bacterium]
MRIRSFSEKQTFNLGKKLATFLKIGDTLCLYGPLGAGKTIFVKGIANGLGIPKEEVNSPAFVLVNEYKGKIPIFHFDFYRLKNTQEIITAGYEDYFYREGIIIIEWAERLSDYLMPSYYLAIEFKILNRNSRQINISSFGNQYTYILEKFKKRIQ